MHIRAHLSLFVCLGLAACNTIPVPRDQATAVDRQYMNYDGSGQSWIPTDSNPIEVAVIRDSGGTFLGMLIPGIDVYCDGKFIANLHHPSEKVTFYVAPGPHSVKVIYVNPSGNEVQSGQAGTNITAVVGQAIELATGVNPSSNEPIRIFQVN